MTVALASDSGHARSSHWETIFRVALIISVISVIGIYAYLRLSTVYLLARPTTKKKST